MITIKTFVVNPLSENCYIVSDDTKAAVLIDCGALYDAEREAIKRYIAQNHLHPEHLLATHGHLDHLYGVNTIHTLYGLNQEVSGLDEFLAVHLKEQARDFFGFAFDEPATPIGHYIEPFEYINFGHHHLKVIPTPGHTPGSVTFYCKEEEVAFTGDTLFRMSIGRTDFEGGSWEAMQNSLQLLASTLSSDTKIYPGHGGTTTMKDELLYNPYISRR